MCMNNNDYCIGDTIARLRKEKGFTQTQLAEMLGVTDKAVSKWESGGGMPEIMMFPKLAEIFDVTIDYLMTGKAPKENVVTISKIELCAKNDDVEMFKSINKDALKNKDENGYTIIDYIQKYDAKNVFIECYETFHGGLQRDLKINEKVIIKLLIHFNQIDKLEKLDMFKPVYGRTSGDRDKYLGLYLPEYTQYILSEESDNKELLDKYFSIHFNDIINPKTRWQDGYSKAFKIAVELNNSNLITYIWNIIKTINENSFNEYSKKGKQVQQEYRLSFSSNPVTTGMNYSCIYNYSLVKIEAKTIKLLLDNGYVKIAEEINNLNKLIKGETISDTEIEVVKMKQEGSHSESEIFIYSCLEDGVLALDRLLKSTDLNLIINTIQTYPIHKIEKIYKWYYENNWRQIYEFAIDNGISVGDIIRNKKDEAISTFINALWNCRNNLGTRKFDNVLNYEYFKKIGFRLDSFKYQVSCNSRNVDVNLEKINGFINEIRDRIIEDIRSKSEFETQTGDLTKDYFLEKLASGENEIVIIKLCKRLEAFLRKKYKDNESELSVLLDRYCQTFNTTDDEANDYNPQTPKLLQKLRLCRNNIAHSNVKEVSFSVGELQKCIDIVCKMN